MIAVSLGDWGAFMLGAAAVGSLGLSLYQQIRLNRQSDRISTLEGKPEEIEKRED